MVLRGDVWLLTAFALGWLMLGQDAGSLGAPLQGAAVHRTRSAGAPSLHTLPSLQSQSTLQALRPLRSLPRLRTLRDVLPDDSSVCVSETEERLLCTERSRFNLNTFGLRFGKRHGSPQTIPKTRPRTNPKTNPVQRLANYYHLPVPAYGSKLLPT